MKLEFFNRAAGDQATIIREAAAKRGISAVMVEKDFWVRGRLQYYLRTQSSASS